MAGFENHPSGWAGEGTSEAFYMTLASVPDSIEGSGDLTVCYKVFRAPPTAEPVGLYDPTLLGWLHVMRSGALTTVQEPLCPATSVASCRDCPLYPEGCGRAFVYLRTFVHYDGTVKFKVGVSSYLVRPVAQSSPFAVLTPPIPRRDALTLEKAIASASQRVIMNPVGRAHWAYAIKFGFWDGTKEGASLVEFLPEVYSRVPDDLRGLLGDPVLFLPRRHFASELPSWIELLPIRELKRLAVREPKVALGEVVANRGAILLLEYGDSFWIFEPKEHLAYRVLKIVGGKCRSPHFKVVRMKLLAEGR